MSASSLPHSDPTEPPASPRSWQSAPRTPGPADHAHKELELVHKELLKTERQRCEQEAQCALLSQRVHQLLEEQHEQAKLVQGLQHRNAELEAAVLGTQEDAGSSDDWVTPGSAAAQTNPLAHALGLPQSPDPSDPAALSTAVREALRPALLEYSRGSGPEEEAAAQAQLQELTRAYSQGMPASLARVRAKGAEWSEALVSLLEQLLLPLELLQDTQGLPELLSQTRQMLSKSFRSTAGWVEALSGVAATQCVVGPEWHQAALKELAQSRAALEAAQCKASKKGAHPGAHELKVHAELSRMRKEHEHKRHTLAGELSGAYRRVTLQGFTRLFRACETVQAHHEQCVAVLAKGPALEELRAVLEECEACASGEQEPWSSFEEALDREAAAQRRHMQQQQAGVEMEGSLDKKGSKMGLWNTHLCRLADGSFSYLKPNGDLRRFDITLCAPKPIEGSGGCQFQVHTPSLDKPMVLRASSEQERAQWIQAFARCTERLLERSGTHTAQPTGDCAALNQLRSVEGNQLCCDCAAQEPTWASINLGVVLCAECSGVHRSMGSHVSKVRSLTLDTHVWDREVLQLMARLGNARVNAQWREHCALQQQDPGELLPDATRAAREQLIRRKYGQCSSWWRLED